MNNNCKLGRGSVSCIKNPICIAQMTEIKTDTHLGEGGGGREDVVQHLYSENVHKHKVDDQWACCFEPSVIKATVSNINKSPTQIITASWNGE